nr:hypothetical protein Iba_chr10dCG8470 [Ipomoea batatas]
MHAHLVISVAIEILLTSDVVKFSSLGLWLKKENNFCKQVKENLLQCGGISSTVLRGKEHVREAHLSMVEISRCIILRGASIWELRILSPRISNIFSSRDSSAFSADSESAVEGRARPQ